jgi:ribonuclease HI
MGTATESSVPLAELAGIALALRIANEDPAFHNHDLEFYTDNQGALRTLKNPGQSSGQRIVQRILDDIAIWQEREHERHTLHLHWLPGHEGVAGNEAADLAAKEVTGYRCEQAPPFNANGPITAHAAVCNDLALDALRLGHVTWDRVGP